MTSRFCCGIPRLRHASLGITMSASRILAELVQRDRWQIFAKLLTFPPRAGLAKLIQGREPIAIKHRANVARRFVREWIVCKQAVHVMRALEQSEEQCDEPRIF